MSHFYGSIPTSARKTVATARGHKNTGLATLALGWKGGVRTYLYHENGHDWYEVHLVPHPSTGGQGKLIASGLLDASELTDP